MTKTCNCCGYTFKTGDVVHEYAHRSNEYETICDMCYTQIVRRNR